MTFAFTITLNSALKILRKHYVTDRQVERQKIKNNISLEKIVFSGGCFPICQCLPPSSNEHIFSISGVHVLLYNFVFTFSYSKYPSSILSHILCKTLDIPRILKTLIYFKTVNTIIKNMTSSYKIP